VPRQRGHHIDEARAKKSDYFAVRPADRGASVA